MRVALIHDWLVSMRGGERVLEAFCELFPSADLYTLVHAPGACSRAIEAMRIHPSFIDRLPLARERYRHYLPLFPHAIEAFDLNGYDLVLSSSHCVAKGVVTPPSAVHVSYVHTPMRYIWDQYPEYFGPGRAGALTRLGARAFSTFLRTWDEASASRVDVYVANSHNVAARIEKRYRRRSEVVHPPVQVNRFRARPRSEIGDYYLMVTAFAPYKKVDLAIDAFKRMGKKLKIVGAGQEEARIRALVAPPIELIRHPSDDQIADLYGRARALIFPGEEDAGITPLEAQASGRPVIALGRGGALETVVGLGDGPAGTSDKAATGLFFQEPTVDALMGAVLRFEANAHRFDPAAARANAERFDVGHFKSQIAAVIDRAVRSREFRRRPDTNVAVAVH
jgi:glycosyltransferase involved in cell wall biosynthesis